MRMMKAAELVLDFDLYPRNNIDSHNVRNLIDALTEGVELPAVIIDKKSKRVVDGFHRVRAHLKYLGDDAKIGVVERSYKDEAAMFVDAMKYNAAHGCKLDPCDRTHCVIIAERLHIPIDKVAGALNMPADKLGSLRNGRTAKDSAGLTIPLKRTVRHAAGRRFNKRQVEANDKLSGMNQVFYVNQIIELIESDLLNKEDEGLIAKLRVLHGLLDDVLVT